LPEVTEESSSNSKVVDVLNPSSSENVSPSEGRSPPESVTIVPVDATETTSFPFVPVASYESKLSLPPDTLSEKLPEKLKICI
jgi:hypothetical protein